MNLGPPKSPHPDFRWMVFFYIKTLYNINDNIVPLLPVYVLAHKDFKWEKGKLPPYIPVPRSLVPYKNSLQVQDIELKFIQKEAKATIRDQNLLLPPKGVDPKKAF